MPRNLRSRALYMLPALALLAGSVTAFSREGRPACQVAAEWVKNHTDALPRDLAHLKKFDLTYQRAIFSALSMRERRAILREWLGEFVQPSSKLSADQLAMVRLALDSLDLLTGDGAEQARERLGFGKARLSAVFGDSLAVRIFASLPSSDDAVGGKTKTAQCECSINGDFCAIHYGAGAECIWGGFDCFGTEAGCGWFLFQQCNGDCGLIT
jgi:hypothetical protein